MSTGHACARRRRVDVAATRARAGRERPRVEAAPREHRSSDKRPTRAGDGRGRRGAPASRAGPRRARHLRLRRHVLLEVGQDRRLLHEGLAVALEVVVEAVDVPGSVGPLDLAEERREGHAPLAAHVEAAPGARRRVGDVARDLAGAAAVPEVAGAPERRLGARPVVAADHHGPQLVGVLGLEPGHRQLVGALHGELDEGAPDGDGEQGRGSPRHARLPGTRHLVRREAR